MRKMSKTVVILSLVFTCVVTMLLTYFGLMAAGVIARGQIEITVTIQNQTKEYDGVAMSKTNPYSCTVSSGTLIEGHTLDVVYLNDCTDVGETEISANVNVLDANGAIVTNDYKITLVKGKMKITSRALTLKLKDATKAYDSKPLSGSDYEAIVGSLAKGHHVEAVFVGSQTDVGSNTKATLTPYIYDYAGNDVTSNYLLDTENGTLTVTKQTVNVSVKFEGKKKIYDGFDVDFETTFSFLDPSLNDYYVIEVDSNTMTCDGEPVQSVLNAGTYFVKPNNTDIKIKTLSGDDVTTNFDIAVQSSTFTILKKSVTLYGADDSHTYDGKEYSTKDLYNDVKSSELIYGDEITSVEYETKKTNVGKYENVIKKVVVKNGDNVATKNYDYKYLPGTLTISEELTVPSSITIEYNSDLANLPEYYYDISSSNLSLLETGHKMYLYFDDLDLSSFTPGNSKELSYDSILIFDEIGKNVTDSYSFTIPENQTIALKINQKKLNFISSNITKVANTPWPDNYVTTCLNSGAVICYDFDAFRAKGYSSNIEGEIYVSSVGLYSFEDYADIAVNIYDPNGNDVTIWFSCTVEGYVLVLPNN